MSRIPPHRRPLYPPTERLAILEVKAARQWSLEQTAGRILKEKPAPAPTSQASQTKRRVVTSKSPDHLWMADLITVPIGSGFWTTWLPFSLPQSWPFCWWIGIVIDHCSRRIMGVTLFWREPTSQAFRAFLGRVMQATKAKPKHLVMDKGLNANCGNHALIMVLAARGSMARDRIAGAGRLS